MKRLPLICLALILAILSASGQDIIPMKDSYYCSQKKMSQKYLPPLTENTRDSHLRMNIDVLNYTLKLNLYNCYSSPYPKNFTGFRHCPGSS